jgi:hypothetical protein
MLPYVVLSQTLLINEGFLTDGTLIAVWIEMSLSMVSQVGTKKILN